MSIENENFRKQEYLACIADAKEKSKNYTGTEQEYNDLFAVLQKIDILIAEDPTFVGNGSIEKEQQAVALWQVGDDRLTLSQLIDIAHTSQLTFLKKSLESAEKSGLLSEQICLQKLKGVIFPTKKGMPSRSGDAESGKVFESARFEERVVEILEILKSGNVFLDDIIIKSGDIDPNMMRQESYIAIEVPRLSRMILVCDQVGEATFVIQGSIPDEQLLSLDKEELQTVYQGRIEKVEKRSAVDWKLRIKILLFDQDVWENREEINTEKLQMKEIVFWREKVKEEIPTIEKWMALDTESRLRLQLFGGKSLATLAKTFEVEGNPKQNTLAHLYLGRKIFGDSPKLLAEIKRLEGRKSSESFDMEAWKELVRKQVPSAKEWITLKDIIRLQGLGGRTLKSLANRLGLESGPLTNSLSYLNLGKVFFGEDPVLLDEIKKIKELESIKAVDEEALKEQILAKIDVNKWLTLSAKEKHALKDLFGIGIFSIARKFGVVGDPVDDRIVFLELGRKIFGDDPRLVEEMRIEKLTLDEWKIEIQKDVGDVLAWLNIKSQDRLTKKILGRTLRVIASVFGLGLGNTVITDKIHLELGIKIYGSVPVLVEALKTETMTLDEWRNEIYKKVPDVEAWIHMRSSTTRRNFSVRGVKITKIARIFAMKGRPIENYLEHLKLGEKIFGNSPGLDAAIHQEENRQK